MKKLISAAAVSAVLLSGCGAMDNSSSQKSKNGLGYDSYITLKAEDENLLNECTEIAEARLMAEYPQLECKISYKRRDAFSFISFDRPENWNDSTLDSLCSCGKVTFRKGTDSDKDEDGNAVPIGEIILQNPDIVSASVMLTSPDYGQDWAVSISMADAGSMKFAQATEELAGSDTPLSIWFDNELISAPKVTGQITDGQAVITGNFTMESATQLANAINSGALPCGLQIIKINIGDEEK